MSVGITWDIIVQLATPCLQVLLEDLAILARAPEVRSLYVSISTAKGVARINALAL